MAAQTFNAMFFLPFNMAFVNDMVMLFVFDVVELVRSAYFILNDESFMAIITGAADAFPSDV